MLQIYFSEQLMLTEKNVAAGKPNLSTLVTPPSAESSKVAHISRNLKHVVIQILISSLQFQSMNIIARKRVKINQNLI